METQVEQQFDTALDAANHDRNQAMLDFAKRLYAPIVQEMETDMAALRKRLQLAEAQLEVRNETMSILAGEFIDARRRANELKKRSFALLAIIRNEREARRALELLIADHEAQSRKVFGVPLVGTIEPSAKFGNRIGWDLAGKAG
jgi:hypothetical protein